MDLELLRKRLIDARTALGYNRKDFASALGIPYRTVTNYENGAREPGSDYISKVADFCNCTTDWLLGLSDSRSNAGEATVDPQIELLVNICRPLNSAAISKLIAYAEELTFNPANKK